MHSPPAETRLQGPSCSWRATEHAVWRSLEGWWLVQALLLLGWCYNQDSSFPKCHGFWSVQLESCHGYHQLHWAHGWRKKEGCQLCCCQHETHCWKGRISECCVVCIWWSLQCAESRVDGQLQFMRPSMSVHWCSNLGLWRWSSIFWRLHLWRLWETLVVPNMLLALCSRSIPKTITMEGSSDCSVPLIQEWLAMPLAFFDCFAWGLSLKPWLPIQCTKHW